MGLGDGLREVVADVGVQTGDINTAAVTSSKINNDAGKFFTGTFAGGGDTVAFTIACTAAVTLLSGWVQITTEHSAASTFRVGDSAASAVFLTSPQCSTTRTITSHHLTAAGSTNPVTNIVAGEDIKATMSVLSDEIAGTYFINYIETPT
jgi:uncharacterized cupin superfamily protein